MHPIVNRLIVLFATAMPGLQKILTLLFIGLFYDFLEIGEYVNDSFIVFILAFFTTLNWSGILLVDVNKYPLPLQNKFFGKIVSFSMTYIVVLLPVFFVLWKLGWLLDFWGSIFFLIAYSVYQLWRHYYISNRFYGTMLLMDSLLLTVTFAICYLCRSMSISLIGLLAVPYFIPFIIYLCKNRGLILFRKSFFRNKLNRELHKRASQNAFSNFFTGSLPLFIAPLSYNLLSGEYTAVLGFFGNIATFLVLLPRAVSMDAIPSLSKLSKQKTKFISAFRQYEKFIMMLIGGILLIVILAYLVGVWINDLFDFFPVLNLPYLSIICFFTLLLAVISQIMLPRSNLLMILRKENILFKINLFSFSVTIALFIMSRQILQSPLWIVLCFQIIQGFMHIVRFFLVNKGLQQLKPSQFSSVT